MSRTRRLAIIAGGTAAVLAVVAFAAWWFLLRSTAPPAVSLDEAVAAASSTTAPASEPTGVAGAWVVSTGNGSFAGYRVNEELAQFGFQEAAGRSEEITGTLTIVGGEVTDVEIVVDTTALTSDQQRRDGAIRDQALETRVFPAATFSLTKPISLPADVSSGSPFEATAAGDLTLHGVTRRVTIDLQAQLVDGTIAVVGSTPILFSDYQIDKPQAMLVLSVDDHEVMEFQLLFERA